MEIIMSGETFARQVKFLVLDCIYNLLLAKDMNALKGFTDAALALSADELDKYYDLLEAHLNMEGYHQQIEEMQQEVITALAKGFLNGKRNN